MGVQIMVSDIEFGELRSTVNSIEKSIEKLDAKVEKALGAVYGNGSAGIKSDIRDITATVMDLETKSAEMDARLDRIANMVEETVISLRAHLDDPRRTFNGFITSNWKSIVIIVIAIQLIIEVILPAEFTIWSLIEKIF